MPELASVALATARTLLNDDSASLWKNEALLPKLVVAHRELQAKMRSFACPVTRTTVEIDVPAGIDIPTGQPADIVEPVSVWEKYLTAPSGTPNVYVKMTEYDPLPINLGGGNNLSWWRWSGTQIELNHCFVDKTIKILYKRMLPLPSDFSDSLGIIDAELYLGPRVAAIAFGSTGNATAAQWCAAMADTALKDVLVANRGRSPATQRP